jgi:hypothetical protein
MIHTNKKARSRCAPRLRFLDELVTYSEAPGNFRPVIIVPVVMVIMVVIQTLMNMNVCLRVPSEYVQSVARPLHFVNCFARVNHPNL